MFEQSLVRRAGRRRPAAVALSLALQAAGIGAMVIAPLWRPAALPPSAAPAAVMAPAPLVAVSPAAPREMRPAAVRLIAAAPPPWAPPVAVPQQVDAAGPVAPVAPHLGLGGGAPGGMGTGLSGGGRGILVPPPGPAELGPIRVGGDVQAARCMFCPPPGYPPLARMAGISGVVQLAAVIGRDGRVTALRLISGPPILARAALRTVSRWRYRPTELNGQPVRVQTAIRVTFQLAGR